MLIQSLTTLLLTATASLVSAADLATSGTEEQIDLVQLNDGNFSSSIQQGVWLVEHFSPRCPHCRHFAPTWEKLVEDKDHLKRLSNFHMAQVNCLAQGDLCSENEITGYPQLNLYVDGKFVEEFKSERDYDLLSDFIDDHALKYARELILTSPEDDAVPQFYVPNPEGKVADVDPTGFERMRAEGPMLVDFFAPWCPHCKHLRPHYETLAGKLKGKLATVAVDCQAHQTFCRGQDVTMYPTIRYYDGEHIKHYNAAPTLPKLEAFVDETLQAGRLQQIKLEDFEEISKTEPAFFVYLQNFDTTFEDMSEVTKALRVLKGSVPTYTSADPLLYKKFKIANPPPTSVLLAFSSLEPKPVSIMALPATSSALNRFVANNRFPTLVNLTKANYHDIMKNDNHALVVLGAIHSDKRAQQETLLLTETARAWKRGGRPFTQPVWFASVEGDKWDKWLRSMFGLKQGDLPAMIVIDTEMNEFYDTTIEGSRATFAGAETFDILEGVFQHFLKPKKIESRFSETAVQTMISSGTWAIQHPVVAVLGIIVGVLGFVYFLSRCVRRDLNHYHGGYMNEKGHQRLD